MKSIPDQFQKKLSTAPKVPTITKMAPKGPDLNNFITPRKTVRNAPIKVVPASNPNNLKQDKKVTDVKVEKKLIEVKVSKT